MNEVVVLMLIIVLLSASFWWGISYAIESYYKQYDDKIINKTECESHGTKNAVVSILNAMDSTYNIPGELVDGGYPVESFHYEISQPVSIKYRYNHGNKKWEESIRWINGEVTTGLELVTTDARFVYAVDYFLFMGNNKFDLKINVSDHDKSLGMRDLVFRDVVITNCTKVDTSDPYSDKHLITATFFMYCEV